jgi:hypothetical protein
MPDIHSERYRPNPDLVCERCVFGHGSHASWCGVGKENHEVYVEEVVPFTEADYVQLLKLLPRLRLVTHL